ncbi:MAG: hypothetical protein AB7O24_33150 [Kofleriaceae bacterium]
MTNVLIAVVMLTGACLAMSEETHWAAVRRREIDQHKRDTAIRPSAEHAEALTVAIEVAAAQNDYRDRPALLQRDVDFALSLVERTARADPDHLPSLVALRARLLLCAGRRIEALREAERSMALAPNTFAVQLLVPHYGATGQYDKLSESCRAIVAALSTDEERLAMIQLCRDHSPSTARDSWMPSEWAGWYRGFAAGEHHERQRRREAQDSCRAACGSAYRECTSSCQGDDCTTTCSSVERSCASSC